MIRAKYTRLTTVAGRTIINRITISKRHRKGAHRSPRKNPTSTTMAKTNRKNQEYNLTADLNENFKDGDYHLTLEYTSNPGNVDEALQRLKNWKRKIRSFCRRHDLPFKCVDATGLGEKKGHFHHHIVLNDDIPIHVITAAWGLGVVDVKKLNSDGNYKKLAAYFLKNSDEIKSLRPKNSRSYNTSREIVHPEIRREKLCRIPFSLTDTDNIPARKGYRVDSDTVSSFEHALTELPCIEYIEVSLDQTPRIRRHNKGVKVKREPIRHLPDNNNIS